MSQRQLVGFYLGIIALAVIASATGAANGFALDDLPIVADNARVHSLDAIWRVFTMPYWPARFGASLYRPVVTVVFALEWAVANGAPWVFHLTNIALYALLSALVLGFFRQLLRPAPAFAAAALFAVHPVHVEAVANVVGQGELITALATVGASIMYIRARRAGRLGTTDVATIAVLFAIACFAKEHGLLLPVLLAALELTAVRTASGEQPPFADRVRAAAPLALTMAVIGASYLAARMAVVGSVLGEKHVVPLYGLRRLWAMLAVAPHWVRLLTWPAHLSADYSPQQIVLPEGPGFGVVPGLIVLAGAAGLFYALGGGSSENRTERVVARLGLAWVAVTLLPVSNLFSVMVLGERTLLLPSVGAMLMAGAGLSAMFQRAARATATLRIGLTAVVVGLVTLGVGRSRARQPVWRDDATLFAQTAEDAPRSYRAQFFYGQMLFQQGKRAEGERRLRLAIALNPTLSDVSPLNYLATEYRDAGMCPQALPLYERAIANDAQRPDVRYGLAACLLATGRVRDARRLAAEGVRRGELKDLFIQLLARTDSVASRGG